MALIKFYSGVEENRANTILGSVWFLGMCITAIILIIDVLALLLLPSIPNKGIIIIIQWFGITFLCSFPSAIASWILQADLKFGKLLIIRIISQSIFISMLLILIIVKEVDLYHVLLINVIGCSITSLYCILKKWTQISTFTHRKWETIKELFHFGKYSVGASISTNLLRSSDTFIIMFVLGIAGPAAVSMYSIPMRLMEIIEIPLRSIVASGMPAMSEAFNKNKKKEVIYLLEKYAGMLTLALIPVCLFAIIFANSIIILFAGHKYGSSNAVIVFRIFFSFAMFYPIDRFLGVTLDIIHKPKINFIKVIIMLITNIFFDFTGIYLFKNINGVALATLFTFLSGTYFGYYWLRKYLHFSMKGIFETGFLEWKYIIQNYLYKKN